MESGRGSKTCIDQCQGYGGQQISRRGFLWVGLGSLLTFVSGSFVAAVDYLFPPDVEDLSKVVDVGPPAQFPVGSVKYIPEKRFFIVHDSEGFIAISAICTHLGCTVEWFKGPKRFECPCHGSFYAPDGTLLGGPAPRPLDCYEILYRDGRLVANTGRKVAKDYRRKV